MSAAKLCLVVALILLNVVFAAPHRTGAETESEIPTRCIYLYAIAGSRMANAVFGALTKFDAYDEVKYTHDAVELANSFQCPDEPMFRTIDCTVEAVVTNATTITDKQISDCVETSTGQSLTILPR